MTLQIVNRSALESHPMPLEPSGPILSLELTRQAAVQRIHAAERAREQAVIDGDELDRLRAIFQIRAALERWGLERVQTWTTNQAKELGLL